MQDEKHLHKRRRVQIVFFLELAGNNIEGEFLPRVCLQESTAYAPEYLLKRKIGIEAGQPFAADKLTPEQKSEVEEGIKAALEKIKADIPTLGKDVNGWEITLDCRDVHLEESVPVLPRLPGPIVVPLASV